MIARRACRAPGAEGRSCYLELARPTLRVHIRSVHVRDSCYTPHLPCTLPRARLVRLLTMSYCVPPRACGLVRLANVAPSFRVASGKPLATWTTRLGLRRATRSVCELHLSTESQLPCSIVHTIIDQAQLQAPKIRNGAEVLPQKCMPQCEHPSLLKAGSGVMQALCHRRAVEEHAHDVDEALETTRTHMAQRVMFGT